jgi:hypothetical protein
MYAANPSTEDVRAEMDAGNLICISTPKQGNRIPEHALVCLDNGVFGKGYPGDAKWLAWVTKHQPIATGSCSWSRPMWWGTPPPPTSGRCPGCPVIRGLGFRAAYVAQDGHELFAPPWDEFDCLFIGGSTAWKLGPHVAAAGS